MRSPTNKLKLGQALVLGALHGPAELLPISSSAHAETIPMLLGWEYAELDPGLRKAFDVALHAGTVLALASSMRGRVPLRPASVCLRQLTLLAVASAPAAIIGSTFEGQIEQALGTPPITAAALIAGAVAMMLADRSPQERRTIDASALDGLWLGIAQACALVPGVSRAGATRSAARLLRFYRPDAASLSEEVGIPVLAGATLLKAARLRARQLEPQTALAFSAGGAASFVSTIASEALLRRDHRSQRLLPYAIYRVALAALILSWQRRRSTAPLRGRALP